MKQVTFKGAKSGQELSGYWLGSTFFPIDRPVVVKNAIAKDLGESSEYDFEIADAPAGAQSTSDTPDETGSAGGFGGADPAPPAEEE